MGIRASATLVVGPERAERTYLKGIQPRGGFRALMLRSVSFALILIFGAVDLPAQEQEKTPAKELTQYVRDARKAGLKDDQIQQNAVKAGWPEPLVKEAIEYLRATPKAPAAKADSPAATSSVPVAPKTAVMDEKPAQTPATPRSEEHTSELQSLRH